MTSPVEYQPVDGPDRAVGGPTPLAISRLSLVVLVGASGSGKSTFARRHFDATQIVSSDACRGVVSDDETSQAATADAFELLHHIVDIRLRRGLLTVVDATNVQRSARAGLIQLAREHDVIPVAVVLDVPESVCVERNAARPERADVTRRVVAGHCRALRSSLRSLRREGFRTVHILRGVDAVENATFSIEKVFNDRRELTGPFDVIGDIHGCLGELETLLTELGYQLTRDQAGRPIGARHPEGRTAAFLGDLVDRGPDTPGVLRLVMGMVAEGTALCVAGNHENKLVRALDGRQVRLAHGIVETLTQLDAESDEFRSSVREFCHGLLAHYVLDDGRLVIAHAGLKEEYQGRASGRVRSFALYGDTTGETDEYGLPVRYPWAKDYRGRAMVLYGHTPTSELEWVNNTLCLDTGCVFGGRLTALRYPEREIVSVPAQREWYPPARPLTAPTSDSVTSTEGRAGAARRESAILEINDVTGRRTLETRYGRYVVPEENAAAALEVMSRFAIDPRWLIYLPPTMAPCATSQRPDTLEHPAEAFDAYRADGVERVMCEEKHMGSRAVVLVTRSPDIAERRFGVADGTTGAVTTRTGRAFLTSVESTERLLARVRDAADRAGLWDELATDWVLLDAELMPWSAKALGLLREQYAAVAAAGRSALNAEAAVLRRAAERGADVADLVDSHHTRLADLDAFAAAYQRYCWPVEDLRGLRLAPFQLLAGESGVYFTRDHGWHLDVLDRLCAADPDLLATTGRRVVDLADQTSEATGVAWWEELTSAGGEGMVVKPYQSFAYDGRRLTQPGLKCRGRDYLRIIYGPHYLEPDNLRRLRQRALGRKRSLALREYAFGLEALERFVAGEPLWRVHQAVFAVLALESEPVDPRL